MKSRRLSKTSALALIRQFQARAKGGVNAAVIHPLVHRNTSDLSEQRYSTTFEGDELLLRDHEVQGRKVLPGVAYLEMVRVAVQEAMPFMPSTSIVELRNVVWAQPITVTGRKEVTITLFTNGEQDSIGRVEYEISSLDPEEDGAGPGGRAHDHDARGQTLHSQGHVVLVEHPRPARLDIESLRGRMQGGMLEGPHLYPAYERMGVRYGPAHQAISVIRRGERQLLAELKLPSVAQAGFSDYVLHPSLMDAALQAPIGFVESFEQLPERPLLPFSLESIRIFSACTHQMFAWLRYSEDNPQQGTITRLDIDLCDLEGNICVQMRGFTFREVGAGAARSARADDVGSLYAAPEWVRQSLEVAIQNARAGAIRRQIVLCGQSQDRARELEALVPNSRCVSLESAESAGGKTIAQRYSETASACFELIREILQEKSGEKVIVQVVAAGTPEDSMLVGLSGLLKTATLENPRLTGQVVLTPADIGAEQLAELLLSESAGPRDGVVRYAHGIREVLRLRELDVGGEPSPLAFKDQGVYLITGGLGGLGVLFTQEILRQTSNAKVVLTGRSPLSEENRRKLESLHTGRGSIEYRQLDVTDADEVARLIRWIVEEKQQLNGILHAAGVRSDNFILKKTGAELARVLAPKVAGTFNLDEASRDLDLDFMVLFSSGASVMGNSGQADYAVANGFMDQFARHRNEQVAAGRRHGRTLAINWPLWQDGGMGVDAEILERFRSAFGIRPMQTAEGMQAFHCSLLSAPCQVLAVAGDLRKLRSVLLDDRAREAEPSEDEIEEQLAALFSLPMH